jgi:nucleoside-diphosphate-sugar epimerase
VSTAKSNGRSAGKSRSVSAAPLAARPVLVCGGAGFLGSHLCARLLAQGQRVICVDNFCTSEEDTIESLLAHPNFQLLRRDVASGMRRLADSLPAQSARHAVHEHSRHGQPAAHGAALQGAHLPGVH